MSLFGRDSVEEPLLEAAKYIREEANLHAYVLQNLRLLMQSSGSPKKSYISGHKISIGRKVHFFLNSKSRGNPFIHVGSNP